MKYYLFLMIFFSVIFPLYLGIDYVRKLRFDTYFRLVSASLLKNVERRNGMIFFSYPGVMSLLRWLSCPKNKVYLFRFIKGKTCSLIRQLKKKKQFYLLAILESFENLEQAEKLWQKLCDDFPQKELYRAEYAKVLWLNGKTKQALSQVENISEKAPYYSRAVKYYLLSFDMTQNGKMLEASQYASLAQKLFSHEKAKIETGYACLQIGTIYRISSVYDVAQSLFESALSLFDSLKNHYGRAETLGNLGMLMVVQKRYEEAESYFKKAQEDYHEVKCVIGEAEILNQQALLEITRQRMAKAATIVKKALTIHKKEKNEQGQAFSWDILSYIHLNNKNYQDLLKTTSQAHDIYQKEHNVSALLEMEYMQATAYFEQGDLDKAEKILRLMLELNTQSESCYHIANVYNFLGLIFLRKKELQRAKGLFRQAASYEERNNRFNGAAVDYANIALVEQKIGHLTQARKNLELAIDYAKNFGDEDLVKKLEKQIEQL